MSNTPPNTITAILDAFDAKALSPRELTKHYFNRIKASKHNAYITVLEERAQAQAEVAETVIQKNNGKVPRDRFPLLGIPLGIKDVLVMDGVRTTSGSKILENYIPPYTATAVERLEKAGAITLGKLNMDEFAMGGSNENSAYGSVEHPTHPGYTPGGSSGGSASAVGADLCVAALGTDTGGSIRLPAHFSGIVGMKPTYGSVSRYGLIAFGSSLDQVGPMTKNVEDSALLLDVMGGYDPMDSTSTTSFQKNTTADLRKEIDWKSLRIGVPKEYWVDGISSDVSESVKKSIQFFEKKGAKLVDISLPNTQHSVSVYYIVAVSEASSNLGRMDGVRFGVRPKSATEAKDLPEFYKNVRALFGPEVKRRIILGTFALSSGYYDAYYQKACQVRRLITNDFHKAFESCDFIAAPVSPGTAFRLNDQFKDPLKMYLNDILTIPANLSGIPGLSVPCGKDSTGLPIGLQLLGKANSDDGLLRLAHAFEKGRG
jgi:aspartyl-tRNA(Asn)/glutamyl-tRNA(Gln) amidotransferase subunit A